MCISVTTNLLTGEEGLIMKRVAIALLAGVAAAAGLGQSASAADLAVKALPPPPVLQSWTGFYIGVHGGGAWQGNTNMTFQDPNGIIAPVGLNQVGNSALGGIGGLQLGYNWQFAPAWVAGVEGDFSWASLSDNRTATPLSFTTVGGLLGQGPQFPAAAGPINNTSVHMTANTEWLSSVRAKLGFTGWLNNTMFYATGGVAWANVEYSAQEANVPAVFAQTFTSVTSFTQVQTGWVVGGGAEWMATPNILLRAEYLFYNFSSGPNASAFLTPNPGAFPAAFNYTWSSYNVQAFRLAGSYKF
jgi:outer membrane immunogenic protein